MSMNAPAKAARTTTQEVEIYFNFVGRYIPPALQPVPLTPEEQEELRKKEERKDRLHQNYLRRKANGKQKEWEERYNAKRKAKMEAAKAAIRAEDMEKGIFTTVSQLTQAGAAQGHPYRPVPQFNHHSAKENEHERIDLHPLRGLLHPRSETFRAAGGSIGKYGRMRQRYLKEHRPGLYSSLILSEKLYPHLLEIDRAARKTDGRHAAHMMEAAGVTRTESQ